MEETWEKDRRKEEEADKREKRKVFLAYKKEVFVLVLGEVVGSGGWVSMVVDLERKR